MHGRSAIFLVLALGLNARARAETSEVDGYKLCLVVATDRPGGASLLRYERPGGVLRVEVGDLRGLLDSDGAELLQKLLGKVKPSVARSVMRDQRDARGRVVETTKDGHPYTGYEYDSQGRIVKMTSYVTSGSDEHHVLHANRFTWAGKALRSPETMHRYLPDGDALAEPGEPRELVGSTLPYRLPFAGTVTDVESAAGDDGPFSRLIMKYDASGRLTGVSYAIFDEKWTTPALTRVYRWQGDKLMRIEEHARSNPMVVDTFAYHGDALESVVRTEGARETERHTYTYDARGRVATVAAQTGRRVTTTRFGYACDAPATP